MKRKYISAALVFAACLSSCSESGLEPGADGGTGVETTVTIPADAVEGELFIKFKPEVADVLEKAGMLSRAGGEDARSGILSVDQILDIAGAYTFQRVFPVDSRNEARTRLNGLHLWYVAKFSIHADLAQVAADMAALAEVSTVECNRQIKRAYNTGKRAKGVSEEALRKARVLDGRNEADATALQWSYQNDGTILGTDGVARAMAGADVNCVEAWTKCKGDPSVIVAVLDEGVMYDHPDLAGNMWVNPGEANQGSATDNDGNGYAGDRYGYNFVDDCGLITYSDMNDAGHATHVAGTIAAVNGNGIGVQGIAGGSGQDDGVRIMTCQIFSGEKGSTILMEVKAIKYAADNGAVIMQCSWGYMSGRANMNYYTPGYATEEAWIADCALEKDAMDYFINNAGSPNGVMEGGIIVFAAGNEYAPMAGFPGAYHDYISVASIGPDGLPAPYSNYFTPSGSGNMITAPGGDGEGTKDEKALILSTMPSTATDDGSYYGYMEGTSMACPHVSGVAALGLSYAAQLHKHFRAEDYRRLILESGKDMDSRLNGEKPYWFMWSNMGDAATRMSINLPAYRGKMGKLIDAAQVLENVENGTYNSVDMRVPNVYVAVNGEVSLDLSLYMKGETSFTVEGGDTGIAAISMDAAGQVLTVKGLKAGSTQATVKGSRGTSQSFTITVRNTAGGSWM